MTKTTTGTKIHIMGKDYLIKCHETEIDSLKSAATFLEKQMQQMRDSGMLSVDRIAVMTALNIAHQFLNLENQSNTHSHVIQQRLRELQNKVEVALAQHAQMEFEPVE
jgi:cell division protein ZapA